MKINPIMKDIHDQCEMVIITRVIRPARLCPGLYCKEHATLIKWLSISEAMDLRNMGVEDLGMVKFENVKAGNLLGWYYDSKRDQNIAVIPSLFTVQINIVVGDTTMATTIKKSDLETIIDISNRIIWYKREALSDKAYAAFETLWLPKLV